MMSREAKWYWKVWWHFGYSHLQAFEMMAEHFGLSEEEYWHNVKLYSLKELD
jgi:hypothetical protein